MRIIFFAGKGGVGKTSISAATGLKAASQGKRTVILSLDVAHSLSDIFDLDRALLDQNRGKPVKVDKNLWIQELDIQEEIQKNWGEIHRYFSVLLSTSGLNDVMAEELAILPGMEEVSLLLYINRYVQRNLFEVIILDCAPTGESLRFISIPTTLEWYMQKIFKLEKTIVKYARPVVHRVSDVPLPDNKYFDDLESLFQRLHGVDQILTDPKTTSVRLITNPEKIVLKETQRAFMYFLLHGVNIDAVIMNRVLPDSIKDNYFNGWRESQRKHLEKAQEYFSPVPILPANLFRGEVFGQESLQELGNQVYDSEDPLQQFFSGKPYHLSKENYGYRLTLRLPFVEKTDIDLNKFSDELVIRVGSYRRHILLPRSVASIHTVQAHREGQNLYIDFQEENHEQG